MIFVGDDWSEDHHDIEILDESGKRLARRRFAEGANGMAAFQALVADHAKPADVVVGIETDRGLWPAGLVAAGYRVYAINPKAVSRYRERHAGSGAKSDPGDAKVLADLVRTDRHNHRTVAGDSELAEAIKVLARAHHRLVWAKRRHVNGLRAILREFYPAALSAFGEDLDSRDALSVLGRAPTPAQGRVLSRSSIAATLRRGGRRRGVEARAAAIQTALRRPQLAPPNTLADAFGAAVSTAVQILLSLNEQIRALEQELEQTLEQHPDAAIIRSLPGLGVIVGARVLGEFGDDPNPYLDAKARRNYAGTSPITVASGKKKMVKARYVRNRHLADACYWWAFSALTLSPGARRYYDRHRARGATHDQAIRSLGNKLVGILDGCLRSRTPYNEERAWPEPQPIAA